MGTDLTKGEEYKKVSTAIAAWRSEDLEARENKIPEIEVLVGWLMAKWKELTFNALSSVNTARADRWHRGFPNNNDGWTGADWSNAMCGEAGEAANVVKKIRRIETGVRQAEQGSLSNRALRDDLVMKLCKEIGDTVIYADLLATHYGLDLEECVTYAFNQVSEREGFPERL